MIQIDSSIPVVTYSLRAVFYSNQLELLYYYSYSFPSSMNIDYSKERCSTIITMKYSYISIHFVRILYEVTPGCIVQPFLWTSDNTNNVVQPSFGWNYIQFRYDLYEVTRCKVGLYSSMNIVSCQYRIYTSFNHFYRENMPDPVQFTPDKHQIELSIILAHCETESTVDIPSNSEDSPNSIFIEEHCSAATIHQDSPKSSSDSKCPKRSYFVNSVSKHISDSVWPI
jgi:hypothetical protein